MAGQPRASWNFVFLSLYLLQHAAGFLGNANAGLRRAGSCGTSDILLGTAADHGGGGSRGTPPRPAGVGGLRAGFEVEIARDLELGSVLVAGADNYGHMTFKVWTAVHRRPGTNKTEIPTLAFDMCTRYPPIPISVGAHM